MIRKLGHLCLITDNLERLLEFYHRGIGLPIKFPFRNDEGQIFGYYLECGEMSFIEIFDQKLKCKQWGGEPVALAPSTQANHFCLEVMGLKDFCVELEGRGVKIHNFKTGMDHSVQAWTRDPDGNLIEFMEYTPRSWQLRGNEPK
jgi:catechol 2,3-dioxygenase-like lactoylglutathione lyase family enzyme